MLRNYELIIKNDQALSEFLLYLYENNKYLSSIDIPIEWQCFIDEYVDMNDNRYYILTNRALEILINERLIDNIKYNGMVKLGQGINIAKKINTKGNNAIFHVQNVYQKGLNTVDKGIDKTVGKKLPKTAGILKSLKTSIPQAGITLGLKTIGSDPYTRGDMSDSIYKYIDPS